MPTFNTDFLPAQSGLNLGRIDQTWNVFGRNLQLDGIVNNLLTVGTGDPAPNISPTYFSVQAGTAANPLTDCTGTTPPIQFSEYDSTATPGAGYGSYCTRISRTTGAAGDVISGATLGVFNNVFSGNSGGTGGDTSTAQVGIIVNSTALSADANANVLGINVQVNSQYTGTLTQTMNGVEVDVTTVRTPGHFGDASAPYALGFTAVIEGSHDATRGLAIDSSNVSAGWLDGVVVSAARNFAFGVLQSTVSPTTGIWVNAAQTHGIFVGARALHPVNPSEAPAFDSDHNPTVGIALGERAATSGISNTLRFYSTSGGSVIQTYDINTDASNFLTFSGGGAKVAVMDASGNINTVGNIAIKADTVPGPSHYIALSGSPTGTRTATFPDNSGTVAELNLAQTWSASQTFTTAVLTAVAPTVAAAQIGIGSTTASTVGSAGGASALPAQPTGYWIINVAGTAQKVPYYNN